MGKNIIIEAEILNNAGEAELQRLLTSKLLCNGVKINKIFTEVNTDNTQSSSIKIETKQTTNTHKQNTKHNIGDIKNGYIDFENKAAIQSMFDNVFKL